MTILILGLILFMGVHLIPSFAGLRARLVARTGENQYKGFIGLLALIGFALIIWGYISAPSQPLWIPLLLPGKTVAVLMIVSVVVFVSSAINSNIKRFVLHPQLTGVALFSIVHLLVNGDLASVILFGSFLLFALIAIISALIRKLGSDIGRQTVKQDIKVLAIGAAIYVVLVSLHPYVFGVPAI